MIHRFLTHPAIILAGAVLLAALALWSAGPAQSGIGGTIWI